MSAESMNAHLGIHLNAKLKTAILEIRNRYFELLYALNIFHPISEIEGGKYKSFKDLVILYLSRHNCESLAYLQTPPLSLNSEESVKLLGTIISSTVDSFIDSAQNGLGRYGRSTLPPDEEGQVPRAGIDDNTALNSWNNAIAETERRCFELKKILEACAIARPPGTAR